MTNMNTGCSSYDNWKGLFQEAMLELDKTKLPERVRDAQQAIVNHMEEVFSANILWLSTEDVIALL
jgi:hypothetical protein